jgi:hypothetical protein
VLEPPYASKKENLFVVSKWHVKLTVQVVPLTPDWRRPFPEHFEIGRARK